MVLILSTFIVIVFAIIMWLNFKSAQEFVQNQLYINAQNTANSLAVSLTSAVDLDDISAIETTINAVFDSGYYQEITFYDMEGKIITKDEDKIKVKDVPQWFINLIDIEITPAKSLVNKGWVPMGQITVKNHTGLAYLKLWKTMTELFYWFAIITIFTLLGIFFLLKIILNPLYKLQTQALAIIDGKFIIQKKLPFTTEFKQLTISMNKMVEKVENIFKQSSETLKKYNKLLYFDTLTGLGNRKYFTTNFENYLKSEGTLSEGILILLSIQNIEKIKQNFGFQSVKDLLLKITKFLNKEISNINDSFVSKINETDFVLVLPSTDEKIASSLANKIIKLIDNDEYCINIAIVNYGQNDSIPTVLTVADTTLSHSISKGCNIVETYVRDVDNIPLMGKTKWRKEILSSIENNKIILATQPVITQGNDIYHVELFTRMVDSNNNILDASVFIPHAYRIGLINDLDKHIFSLVLNRLRNNYFNNSIAINISSEFLKESKSYNWLQKELTNLKKYCNIPIYFEIRNNAVLQDISIYEDFSYFLSDIGLFIGIDNFTANSNNFDYLRKIRPAYLKIHQRYLNEITADEVSVAIGESLKIITSTYDIKIIATNIETKQERDILLGQGIKHFQGNYIKKVEIIKDI
jgi:EAL domain-containing protein (putative c-di-GMP-specific phosphodiesterase class I)/GGDEF domain-containing protein